MRIDITANGLELTDGLRNHTERRLAFALDRSLHSIGEVIVRLTDINGTRGGLDERCQIRIPLSGRQGVVIEETNTDLYVAIDRATRRVGNTLGRHLSRGRQSLTPRAPRAHKRASTSVDDDLQIQ